jgi:hypothetical protein
MITPEQELSIIAGTLFDKRGGVSKVLEAIRDELSCKAGFTDAYAVTMNWTEASELAKEYRQIAEALEPVIQKAKTLSIDR